MRLIYNIRIWIGRIEKCSRCGKRMLNRKESLHFDLYMKQRDCTWCPKCMKKEEQEKK